MFPQEYNFTSVWMGSSGQGTQQINGVLTKPPSSSWHLNSALLHSYAAKKSKSEPGALVLSWPMHPGFIPQVSNFFIQVNFLTFVKEAGLSVKMNPGQLFMLLKSRDILALKTAVGLGWKGQVSYWLEKSRLCCWYCDDPQHPRWAWETQKCLSLGSTENRAWAGVPNLKGEVVRQGELMKGGVWQGRLQSHSLSLHWPLLYREPQRHTAGLSAGAAYSTTWDSSRRLCIEAAPSSPFKEEGEECLCMATSPL